MVRQEFCDVSVKGFGEAADTFLNMAEEVWSEMRDAQGLVGQEDGGWGRKLPCNQNLEFSFSSVDPDLVSRSAGLSAPGHQCQLAVADRAEISMILVP